MVAWILVIIAAVLLFGAAAVRSAICVVLAALGCVAFLIALVLILKSATGSDVVAYLTPLVLLVAVTTWAKTQGAARPAAQAETGWSPEEQMRLAEGTTRAHLEARSKRT